MSPGQSVGTPAQQNHTQRPIASTWFLTLLLWIVIYKSLPIPDALRAADRSGRPVDKTTVQDFSDLFYEPFYQLLRQQLLAHEMELAQELGCDLVTVLHGAPADNRDFHRVTSPGLQSLGDSSIEVWKGLLRQPGRFVSVSTETLFGDFLVDAHPELADWWQYTSARYPWLQRREAGSGRRPG